MISDQSRAGIGSPRPWLRGLSATVAGLQNPSSNEWHQAYEINRFGEDRFKVAILAKRSTSSIGGGLQ
jgi:hypothetical protein